MSCDCSANFEIFQNASRTLPKILVVMIDVLIIMIFKVKMTEIVQIIVNEMTKHVVRWH